MDPIDAIIASLQPLFEQAEREGLWFHSAYQDLWFSPAQLREQHAKGSFVWGPVNWTLRDPQELVAKAEGDVMSAQRRVESMKALVGR